MAWWHGGMEYVWPKPFLVEHVRTNTAGALAPGRANGAASRPRPDPALPAPRPSPPTILVRTLGKQACTCRATTCLCARARGSPDLLGDFSRQMQIWLSNAIRGPGLVTLAKQPGQPTCHAFFSQRDPFQPSTRCLSLLGTVADFDGRANQRQRPDHERNSADCTIDGPDELTSHRRAIIACLSLSWPRLRHRSACSLTHAPHSTARRARFGPCPVSALYLGSSAFSRCSRPPGAPPLFMLERGV